jgi:short-subunit dehydrogenase
MKKTALVTGASSGIGYEVTKELANQGIQVTGIARRNDKLNQLKKENPLIHTLSLDLSKPNSYTTLKTNLQNTSTLDYIVHCAGQAGPFAPLTQININELNKSLALDVQTPVLLLQHLYEHLKKTRLLFIGSYSAKQPRQNWAVYSIAKAAQLMLARCLEKEDHPIQVGILYPGAVYSDIYNSAVSQSPKTFPDQPEFQEFIDNNTVKTAKQAAKQCIQFLIESSDEVFHQSIML